MVQHASQVTRPGRGVCLQGGLNRGGMLEYHLQCMLGYHPFDTWDTMRSGQEAGATQPTGTHSCFRAVFDSLKCHCKHHF